MTNLRWLLAMLSMILAMTWNLPVLADPGPSGQVPQKSLQRLRNEIRAMRAQTMRKLHQLAPDSPQELRLAAGYAVFQSHGTTGEGLVHNNQTGRDIYMKMANPAAAMGAEGGFRESRWILILQRETLEQLIREGWTFDDPLSDTAKTQGIKIYQITDSGLIPPTVQVSLQGSRCWPDETLNAKLGKAR